MAALVTVLLTVVSASIAYAFAVQATTQSAAVANRLSASSASQEASLVLNTIEAALLSDPVGFYRRVLPGERPRVCVAGPFTSTVFSPGEEFPRSCGPVWGYTTPTTSTAGAVELIPPSVSEPNLRVRALGRAGNVDSGWEASYRLDGAGRWVWATTGDADLSTGQLSVSGSVYAGGTITVTPASAEAGTMLAAEEVVSGDVSASWLLFDGSPATSDRADIREVQPIRLSAAALRTGVAALGDVGCPDEDAQTIDGVQAPGLGSAQTVATSLCIRSGAVLAGVDSDVTVPADAEAFLLTLNSDDELVLYTRSEPVDMSTGSPWLCAPQPLCSLAALQTGNHPGGLEFWGEPLGVLPPPLSGVVVVDGQTFFGACSGSRGEYGLGEICASVNGFEPGVTISRPLTVVAGTLADPADLVVNSTSYVEEMSAFGLVATSQIVIPHWIAPPGGVGVVAADMLGLATPAVRFLPESFPEATRASTFAVVGSLMGPDVPVVNPWTQTWRVGPSRSGLSSPWWPGDSPVWTRVTVQPMSGVDVCGSRQCLEWLPGEFDSVVDEVPVAVGAPSPPREVSAVPGFSSVSQVVLVFTAPADPGSSAVEEYEAVCTSPNGGVETSVSGSGSPLVVTGLDPRVVYTCEIRARNSSGWSRGVSSPGFVALGPPDAPFDVTATPVQLGVVTAADVGFRVPLNNGGLPLVSFEASCSSGTDTRSASGLLVPLRVEGLTVDEVYRCRVRAVNAAGAGEWSALSDSFTAVAAVP